MAKTKVIIIDVQTEEGRKELEKLRKEFENVEDQAKKTDKSVDDVASNGGAIAILDQLTGGLATRLRDAYEASKLFNFSLKATRGALIATGIGAFVVALGVVLTYWEDISDAIDGADDELEDLNKTASETVRLFKSLSDNVLSAFKFSGLIDFTDDLRILRREFDDLDKAISKLEESGEDTPENITTLIGKYKEYLDVQNDIELVRTKINDLDPDDEDFKVQQERLSLVLASLLKQKLAYDDIFDSREKLDEKDKKTKKDKEVDPLDELLKELEDETLIGLESNQRAFEREKSRKEKLQEIEDFYFLKGLERDIANIERETDKQVNELIALGAHRDLIEKVYQDSENRINKIVKDASEKRSEEQNDTEVKWADLTAEAKLGIAQSALGAVAGLVDQQSVAGKGIAIAQTGINTATGIIKAISTNPPPSPLGIIGAALVGAAGIAQTIKIASTKIPSATGKGFVSGGSGGASTPSAPAFNLVQGTEGNQLSEDIQGVGQEPVRAVVVSGDVTTAQSVDRNIESESGI